MTDYLCNFVRAGDPNGDALPQWLPSGKNQPRVLHMGEKPTQMDKPNLLKLIGIMLTNKAVGE